MNIKNELLALADGNRFLIGAIRKIIYIRDYIGYRRLIRKWNFKIFTTEETIDYIISNRVSVSRFGDGEYLIMLQKNGGFQEANAILAQRLRDILNSSLPSHVVCIPYALKSDKHLNYDARYYWHHFCCKKFAFIEKLTPKSHTFYDASFTRFYIDLEDRKSAITIILKLKRIWENRDVFIVEGESTRLGVDNDLLDNVKSIKRILCPSVNAFSKYHEILDVVKRTVPKDSLILCALGMTATVLSYDLAIDGFQAIDIGHVDVEYTWYKMKAQKKCAIPNKAVYETGISYVSDDYLNESYKSSIVAYIH